jgi:hypothetical protein
VATPRLPSPSTLLNPPTTWPGQFMIQVLFATFLLVRPAWFWFTNSLSVLLSPRSRGSYFKFASLLQQMSLIKPNLSDWFRIYSLKKQTAFLPYLQSPPPDVSGASADEFFLLFAAPSARCLRRISWRKAVCQAAAWTQGAGAVAAAKVYYWATNDKRAQICCFFKNVKCSLLFLCNFSSHPVW